MREVTGNSSSVSKGNCVVCRAMVLEQETEAGIMLIGRTRLDLYWVRALMVPMHLDLTALCAP